jgi:hypothetical protein
MTIAADPKRLGARIGIAGGDEPSTRSGGRSRIRSARNGILARAAFPFFIDKPQLTLKYGISAYDRDDARRKPLATTQAAAGRGGGDELPRR